MLGQREPIFNSVGAAITKDNKHVVETVKWLDYKYGEEGSMLFNFGIEGKSYEMKDGLPDVYRRNYEKSGRTFVRDSDWQVRGPVRGSVRAG